MLKCTQTFIKLYYTIYLHVQCKYTGCIVGYYLLYTTVKSLSILVKSVSTSPYIVNTYTVMSIILPTVMVQ